MVFMAVGLEYNFYKESVILYNFVTAPRSRLSWESHHGKRNV